MKLISLVHFRFKGQKGKLKNGYRRDQYVDPFSVETVFIHHILTSKDGPRPEKINQCIMAVVSEYRYLNEAERAN